MRVPPRPTVGSTRAYRSFRAACKNRSESRSWRLCTIARHRALQPARRPGSRGRSGPRPPGFLALARSVEHRSGGSRSSRSAAGSPKWPRLLDPSWLASVGSVVAAAVASVRTGAHERSSRQGKYETSLVDEKNHADELVARTGRAPEPLQDRPPGGVLEVEEGGLQRRGWCRAHT